MSIERTGTGIERSGTGIERSGTGIERSGTGIDIEKSGTGIEKSGTGMRRAGMLITALFAVATASGAFAQSVTIDDISLSAKSGKVMLLGHDGSEIIAGRAGAERGYALVPLFTAGGAQACDSPNSDGSGTGQQSDGSGTGQQSDGSGTGQQSDGSGTGQQSDGSGTGTQSDGSGTGTQSDGSGTGAQSDGSGTGANSDGSGTGGPLSACGEPWGYAELAMSRNQVDAVVYRFDAAGQAIEVLIHSQAF